MAESMLREEVEVYSEKYDIHGVVRDYGMVTKLFFTYEGKDIVILSSMMIPNCLNSARTHLIYI